MNRGTGAISRQRSDLSFDLQEITRVNQLAGLETKGSAVSDAHVPSGKVEAAMPLENQHTLNSFPSGKHLAGMNDPLQNSPAGQPSETRPEETGRNMLSEHKGKLAIGAAAMLGLAIFYKWREHQLAKEDPQEYAQLRRIKTAIETDGEKPQHKNRIEKDETG